MELKPWFGCAYTQLKHIAQTLPHCTVCRLPEDNMMAMRSLMDDKHGGMGRMKAIFPARDVRVPLSSSKQQIRSWSFMQNSTSLVLRAANSLVLLNIAMWLVFEILRCQELCWIRVILHHTLKSLSILFDVMDKINRIPPRYWTKKNDNSVFTIKSYRCHKTGHFSFLECVRVSYDTHIRHAELFL